MASFASHGSGQTRVTYVRNTLFISETVRWTWERPCQLCAHWFLWNHVWQIFTPQKAIVLCRDYLKTLVMQIRASLVVFSYRWEELLSSCYLSSLLRGKTGREKKEPRGQMQGLRDKVLWDLVLSQVAVVLSLFSVSHLNRIITKMYCWLHLPLLTEARDYDKELKTWEQKYTTAILTGVWSCYNTALAQFKPGKLSLITYIHEIDSSHEKNRIMLGFCRNTHSWKTDDSTVCLYCLSGALQGDSSKTYHLCLPKKGFYDRHRMIHPFSITKYPMGPPTYGVGNCIPVYSSQYFHRKERGSFFPWWWLQRCSVTLLYLLYFSPINS